MPTAAERFDAAVRVVNAEFDGLRAQNAKLVALLRNLLEHAAPGPVGSAISQARDAARDALEPDS